MRCCDSYPMKIPPMNTTGQFVIRQAVVTDIPALAVVHAIAWAETYPHIQSPPTVETRTQQWKAQFGSEDKNWFCYLIVNGNGEPVGFAKGLPYQHNDLPAFKGELNKMYILKAYHRQGLGTRLLERVMKHFTGMGIHSMVLFGNTQNPCLAFFERSGGEKLFAANGKFNGGYGWRDLGQVV